MPTHRITVPKNRRAVSIRERLDRRGKLRFSVRFTDDVEGVPKRTEISFATRDEAEEKARLCKLMLGIVHEAKSTIANKMLKTGDLRPLISTFIAEKLDRRVKSRMRAEEIGEKEAREGIRDDGAEWLLRPVPDIFGWEKTVDIPPKALKDIESKLLARGTFVVRETQKLVRALVRRFRHDYVFHEDILEGKLCFHEGDEYYVWLDPEKDLIFQELTAPLRIPPELASWSEAKRRVARKRAEAELAKRRALFLIIWPQMLWGLRPREATLLRVRDWNPATSELTIRITKTRKIRRFVVDIVTATMLTRLTRGRDMDDFIYYTARGKRWRGYNLMSRQFKEVLDRLGLQGSLYSCRHYAATTLAELLPRNWKSVMGITGHKSMEVLERYVQNKGGRLTPAAGEYNRVYQDIVNRLNVSVVQSASHDNAADVPVAPAAPSAPPPAVPPKPLEGFSFTVEDE